MVVILLSAFSVSLGAGVVICSVLTNKPKRNLLGGSSGKALSPGGRDSCLLLCLSTSVFLKEEIMQLYLDLIGEHPVNCRSNAGCC